ncbi:unnamed protein product [Peniophora sp. CBMAI 1063]|nr:unnamed protein product [Peniophora sp. CBMAI 1063]
MDLSSYMKDFSIIQGVHSTTFSTPTLNGELTVPDLFAFHAAHSSKHKLFVYADGDGVGFIDYATAYRGQVVAAGLVKAAYDLGSNLYTDGTLRPVFAILANADSISYATFMLGIQRTGAVPFPISTRNSAIAIAHLIRSTGVHQMFTSKDAAMTALGSSAKDILSADNYRLELLDMPQFGILYDDASPSPTSYSIAPLSPETPALILHSSGTSAFPKPIPITHRTWVSFGLGYYYGDVDVCGIRLGVHGAPMFHVMGASLLIFAACTGLELAVFKPSHPPIVPSASTFYEGVVQSGSEWVVAVPSLIEEWWQDPTKATQLASRVKRIAYGGSPLNKSVGDVIHSQGIVLDCWYGTTETGPLCFLMDSADGRPEEWEYFRLPSAKLATFKLMPQGDQEGLFELFLMAGERFGPSVFNVTLDGNSGYAIGDLIQEHPLHKGYFKLHGRADEQIILSTGEKTNPVPLERILTQDPNIHVAVLFGRGRFMNGALVQPVNSFDPSDAAKVADFRNLVWPTVNAMNTYAPAHSRLLKEMILVASPDKPLELTAKGNPRRNICLAAYEKEIETIYSNVEESSNVGPEPPALWTPVETLDYIRAVVKTIMGQDLGDGDELFSLGCDSLRAAYIRNNIVRALRASGPTSTLVSQVPQNLVYRNPSIRALSDYVLSLVSGSDGLSKDIDLHRHAGAMESMVDKYSAGFTSMPLPSGAGTSPEEVVLITGTTGRLGSHLLAQLLMDPGVHHVYALNRASVGNTSFDAMLQRMRASFELWGLPSALLSDGKVTLLLGDYAQENLGIELSMYAKLKGQVTTIIHNAWRVDFNIALSGFEPLIKGVRHLIDLAIGASVDGGARFVFISSIAVLQGSPPEDTALEVPIADAALAAGMGYGESKWVAESVLLRARDTVGLRVAIVRVGQLAGDTGTGGWNKQEWVGAIARLGQIVRALPDGNEPVSWVPVDVAASALIDVMRADGLVFHLVAPHPSNWRTIFGTFAAHLEVPLVEYREWATRVSTAAETSVAQDDAQLLALADFFRDGRIGEEMKMDSARMCEASPILAAMPPLGEKDALLYLGFWEKIGHLRPRTDSA